MSRSVADNQPLAENAGTTTKHAVAAHHQRRSPHATMRAAQSPGASFGAPVGAAHDRHSTVIRGDVGRRDDGSAAGIPAPREPLPPPPSHNYEHLEPLLAAYAASPAGSCERARLRERLIAGYLPVARNIARRHAQRGEPIEDLTQTATIGLINAIDRYDLTRGEHFLSFAFPTIAGEVRRYFRDKGWSMQVPRRLKALHVTVNITVRDLSQQLGRAPDPARSPPSSSCPSPTSWK